LITFLSALILFTSCSGGGHRSREASDSQTKAVLTGYRAQWADFEAATRTYPINPDNPRIPAHLTGTQLEKVRNQLVYMRGRDQYISGGSVDVSKAMVNQVRGDTASLTDCYLDSSYVVNGATGRPESQPTKQRVHVTVDLALVDGAWRVDTFHVAGLGCRRP
jgi:hypothetical protein